MRRKRVIPTSVRLQVIERDNGLCRACGIGDRDALQCDHIVPESRGGDNGLSNLQALCGVCNNRKGNTDIGELPIREPIDGFGDYATIMHNRTLFLEMVATARENENATLRAKIETWRAAQVKGYIIRRRLNKISDPRKVDALMRG